MSSQHTAPLAASAAPESSARQTLIRGAIAAFIAAAYLYPFMRVVTWTPDEGSYLYGAQIVLRGGLPFRDFVEQYAAGGFYWLALWFKLFGISFTTARCELWAVGIGLALLVFYLTRRLGSIGVPGFIYALTASIPAMVMNSQHFDANLFALLALAVFLWANDRQDVGRTSTLWLYFASGLSAGLSACFIQQKGAYVAAALVVSAIVLYRRGSLRPVVAIVAGAMLPVASEFAWFVYRGAWADLVYANFTLPMRTYSSLNRVPYAWPLGNFWTPKFWSDLDPQMPALLAIALAVLLNLPFNVIAAAPAAIVSACVFKRSMARLGSIPYWLCAYAIWLSESHRLDLGHLRNGCILLVPLLLCSLEGHRHWIARTFFVTATGAFVLNGAFLLADVRQSHTVWHSRRGDLFVRTPDPVLDFLNTHTTSGETVFVYPYRPLYYFAEDLRNPTRDASLVYDANARPLIAEALQSLEASKPRYILVNDYFAGANLKLVFPAYNPPPLDQQIVEQYFEKHYRERARFPGYHVLERLN